MTKKTYRIYISGKVSPRHSHLILHKMLEDLGLVNSTAEGTVNSDQTPSIRNMHRENEEAYFDVDIYNNENDDAASIVDSMKRYILENSVQYEDITDQPPKDM